MAALGPLSVGSRLFTFGGKAYLTALAKLTCTVVMDRALSPARPQPLAMRDDIAGSHVVTAQEVAIAQVRPEVLVVGTAHGHEARSRVSLRVLRGGAVLLDKRVDVVAHGASVAGIPIQHDRALGGIGFDDNPLGIGMSAGDRRPNLVDPQNPGGRVACLAPIPRLFPRRRKRLEDLTPAALDGDRPELPNRFDWTYFQASPPDQQLDALRGDEWIELGGMHPRHDPLRAQLPGMHAVACLYGVPEAGMFQLHLDRVTMYPDDEVATLCFRSNVPLLDPDPGPGAVLAVGLAPFGEVPLFPASPQSLAVERTPVRTVPVGDVVLTTTRAITRDDEEGMLRRTISVVAPSTPRGAAEPFQIAGPTSRASSMPPPGAPWSREPTTPVRTPEQSLVETVALEPPSSPPTVVSSSPPPVSDAAAPTKAEVEATTREVERRREEEAQRFREEQARLEAAVAGERQTALHAKRQKAGRLSQSLYVKKQR